MDDLPSLVASDLPRNFVRGFALCWGAVWGSFANVMIYRWPRELSVVSPPSHCPKCDNPVRWHDNVPVLGWLWLRGKCRDCQNPISPRYPFVEALYGVAGFMVAERMLQNEPQLAISAAAALFLVRFAFAFGLLTVAFIDMETFLIPDVITLPGVVLGVVAAALLPGAGWQAAVSGAALGAAVPLSLWFVWKHLLKREGMGLGDAKLMAMVGAFLGWPGVLFTLCAGSAQGIFASVLARVTGWKLFPDPPEDLFEDDEEGEGEKAEGEKAEGEKAEGEKAEEAPRDEGIMRQPIPFGPFLSLAALEYFFGGDRLMRAYLGLFEP
jgi:leader peptidase (prepilin peptidase)/N-methyltransferase